MELNKGVNISKEPVPITEQNWDMNTVPLVSVACITYNHECFIREALDGFLKQKTTFPVELIVHDDASNDGTRDIIGEYKDKYPRLFNTILQEKNQWSNGGNIYGRFIYPRVKGKYLALCEGDDYWTDPFKLQTQFEYLEKYPKVNLCFHPAISMYENSEKHNEVISKHFNINKLISTEEIIIGGPHYCPTASVCIRSNIIKHDLFVKHKLRYSYFRQIIASLEGGAIYVNKTMSVYRRGVDGSWNDRAKNSSLMLYKHHKKIFKYLKILDKYTNGSYKESIRDVFSKRFFDIMKNDTLLMYHKCVLFIWHMKYKIQFIDYLISRLKNKYLQT